MLRVLQRQDDVVRLRTAARSPHRLSRRRRRRLDHQLVVDGIGSPLAAQCTSCRMGGRQSADWEAVSLPIGRPSVCRLGGRQCADWEAVSLPAGRPSVCREGFWQVDSAGNAVVCGRCDPRRWTAQATQNCADAAVPASTAARSSRMTEQQQQPQAFQ